MISTVKSRSNYLLSGSVQVKTEVSKKSSIIHILTDHRVDAWNLGKVLKLIIVGRIRTDHIKGQFKVVV